MPEISLTEFVDFAIKSGTPKLTEVRRIKRRRVEGYEPSRDYYRKLRDGIIEYHQHGHPKKFLDTLADVVADKNKRNTYPRLIKAYKKFLGRKRIHWFDPVKAGWKHGALKVRVNPEIGLTINDGDHLVKLYFKETKLTKDRIAIIACLMRAALGSSAEGTHISLLDLRNSKLHTFDRFDPALVPLLEGEALAFCRIYRGA